MTIESKEAAEKKARQTSVEKVEKLLSEGHILSKHDNQKSAFVVDKDDTAKKLARVQNPTFVKLQPKVKSILKVDSIKKTKEDAAVAGYEHFVLT